MPTLISDYRNSLNTRTTSLGLNRWQPSDKPTIADFNRDNQIIDEKFQEVDMSLANKANKASSLKYKLPYVAGLSEYFESTYSKGESGLVCVHIALKTQEGKTFETGQKIAELPDGFRPKHPV